MKGEIRSLQDSLGDVLLCVCSGDLFSVAAQGAKKMNEARVRKGNMGFEG